MFNVAMLAPILQALMTTRADELAKQAGFLQRRRGPTGADFLQALTFGVRWEIQQGQVRHLGVHPGSISDGEAEALAPPLPRGALHLADLGFADFGRLADEDEQGVYWVTRLPAQTRLYPEGGDDRPLAEHLAAWREQGLLAVDIDGGVGNEDRANGRLVCLACPPDVAARRLSNLEKDAKKRKRLVSARQREMCRWTVLFSNVPRGWLTARPLWQVYRLRWQIELLFRRFKSEGGLGETASGKRYRVESEWYLKLLGQVIRNWMQLLRGGPLADVNLAQLGRVIADQMQKVLEGLGAGRDLTRVLKELAAELRKVRDRTARQKRKTAARTFAQSLDDFVLLS